MQKGTILNIEDDSNLQGVVNQYLEGDGYTVVSALDARSAMEKVETSAFDAILLDLILPDAEGLTLIQKFKSRSNAGIIVVSGKSDTTEKIICLEMGADDYITKPFEMRELSARIKAVLRRTEVSNDDRADDRAVLRKAEKIYFGSGWCLDRTQYQLLNEENVSADLTTGEFKLLEALVVSPNRALSREHLFSLTREGDYEAFDRAIDIQIGRLRKKLGQDQDFIKTVRGVGYMFAGETHLSPPGRK